MTCYFPISGYRPHVGGQILFKESSDSDPIEISCGQCIGCRLERSRQWAVRCVHEAQLHQDNCFLTLTYDDDFLPDFGNLCPADWELFLKRFRKRLAPRRIRFFMCGEYGDQFKRPHFHAAIFGFDPVDKVLVSTRDDIKLYSSAFLSELWPFGFVSVGALTFDSAAYIARYIVKKVNGDLAHDHYTGVDSDTGECVYFLPEFVRMSRMPGIGARWVEQYSSDLDKDFIVVHGVRQRPPKFYDRLKSVEVLDELKLKRFDDRLHHDFDNSVDRLAIKHEIKLSKLKILPRGLSNDY